MLSDYAKKEGWIEWGEQSAPVGIVVEGCYLENCGGIGGYYENIVFTGTSILSEKYGAEKTRPPDMWRHLK